jgi:hypothetical protein
MMPVRYNAYDCDSGFKTHGYQLVRRGLLKFVKSDYKVEYYLLGCDIMQSGRNLPTSTVRVKK